MNGSCRWVHKSTGCPFPYCQRFSIIFKNLLVSHVDSVTMWRSYNPLASSMRLWELGSFFTCKILRHLAWQRVATADILTFEWPWRSMAIFLLSRLTASLHFSMLRSSPLACKKGKRDCGPAEINWSPFHRRKQTATWQLPWAKSPCPQLISLTPDTRKLSEELHWLHSVGYIYEVSSHGFCRLPFKVLGVYGRL